MYTNFKHLKTANLTYELYLNHYHTEYSGTLVWMQPVELCPYSRDQVAPSRGSKMFDIQLYWNTVMTNKLKQKLELYFSCAYAFKHENVCWIRYYFTPYQNKITSLFYDNTTSLFAYK